MAPRFMNSNRFIEKVLTEAPPLTVKQPDNLPALLRTPAAEHAESA